MQSVVFTVKQSPEKILIVHVMFCLVSFANFPPHSTDSSGSNVAVNIKGLVVLRRSNAQSLHTASLNFCTTVVANETLETDTSISVFLPSSSSSPLLSNRQQYVLWPSSPGVEVRGSELYGGAGWGSRPALRGIWVSPWQSQWSGENDR